MLGAAAAGAQGLKVVLLEKNDRLGKAFLTGNGRCNVTNCGDFEDYQNHIVNNKNSCTLPSTSSTAAVSPDCSGSWA